MERVNDCLHLLADTKPGQYEGEHSRAFGRMLSDLHFLTIEDIMKNGLHEFSQRVQTVLDRMDDYVYQKFMYHPPTDLAAEIRLHQQEMQQQQA